MSQLKGEPPSYESVIASIPDTIGDSTTTQPSNQNIYPTVPSAPPSQPYFPSMSQQQPQQMPNYGSISETIQSQPSGNNQNISDVTTIVGVNGCPICRIGVLEDDYSCLGICLAIFCFPIGIICCLACKNKRCTSCGAII
ncbi:hypothetical protein PVAND_017442 [Polypedilum vanderplanki]|uniref:Membrane protein BRI3 n=1 Tax=Polypedilum vanderplanki TaxID=319348 RepID=A0A9J6BJ18_POLVA|nr:hypothetical protein PVAND_017442 [Polypedilum vanderplanki]